MRRAHLLLVAIALSPSCIPEPEPQLIRQEGYFRDDAGNRVQTYTITPEVTREDVAAHARVQMKTGGQLFAAYYYLIGGQVPADGVTLARSFIEATDVIFEKPGLSKWRYVYMEPLVGPSTFVDCNQDPANDLCRQ